MEETKEENRIRDSFELTQKIFQLQTRSFSLSVSSSSSSSLFALRYDMDISEQEGTFFNPKREEVTVVNKS